MFTPLVLQKRRPRHMAEHRSPIASIATLGGGTAVAQLVVLLTTPLISRIYTPATIGIYTLFFSYVNFLQTGASLMYSAAIPGAKTPVDARALFSLSGRLLVPFSFAGALIFVGFSYFDLLGFGAFPLSASGLVWTCLTLAGAFTTFRFLLVRHQDYARIAHAMIVQNTVRSGGQVVAGLLSTSWWALAAADTIGRAFGSIPGIRGLDRDSEITRRQLRRVAATYKSYPTIYLPSVLIDNLVLWLPLPLLVTQYGASVGGLYAIVSRTIAIPVSMVAASVADVFHGSLSKVAGEGLSPRRAFWSTAKLLTAIGVPIAALIGLGGGTIIPFVLGSEWSGASLYCVVMAPWFLLQFIVSPLSRVVLVYGGQKSKLTYDLFSLFGTLCVFAISSALKWEPVAFIAALSAVNVAAYLIYFVILVRIVNRSDYRRCAELPVS